jgi:hypothetical protein
MPRLTIARYEENFPGANFTDEEREFLQAMDRYKRQYQRPFPSWSEVLGVVRRLGYRKVPEDGASGADPPRPRSA